jgi:spermidine synthase
MLRPQIRSVLFLGLGSGSVGSHLERTFPGLEVTYVDIDPAVPEVASRWLGFRAEERSRVVIDDARRFLAGADRTWDFVYCDTYIGQSVPVHLATREFFAEAKRRLAPGGVLGLNLAGSLRHPFARALVRTVRESFAHLVVLRPPESGNLLLLATDGPPPPPPRPPPARGGPRPRRSTPGSATSRASPSWRSRGSSSTSISRTCRS